MSEPCLSGETSSLHDQITHCLTIGKRPDLLRRTLESLHELRNLPTLAINDFGDAETSGVLMEMCPSSRIVGPSVHLGHHPAVDEMYSKVTTPYIFHGEDDWHFSRVDFLADGLRLLNADPNISVVCFRATNDMPLSDADRARITVEERSGIRFERLDQLHEQWHGYSFNPHLMRRKLWEEIGGFSQFKKERHLSRFLRRKGFYVAFMLPEACRHIGDGRTTLARRPTWKHIKRFKNWMRGIRQFG